MHATPDRQGYAYDLAAVARTDMTDPLWASAMGGPHTAHLTDPPGYMRPDACSTCATALAYLPPKEPTMTDRPDPWADDRDVQRASHQDEQAARQREAYLPTQPRGHCGYTVPHAPHLFRNAEGPDGVCGGTSLPPSRPWTDAQQPVVVNVEQPAQPAYVKPPSRVFHGVLTIATGLLWAPVWFVVERRYRRRVEAAHRAVGR